MKTELQSHQQRVIDRLRNEDAVLVYHGLGSGKTLTALSAADQLNLPAAIIGPASLKHNFVKEKIKHGLEKVRTEVTTYSKPADYGDLLVFDEAHRMGRLESKRSRYPDEIQGKKKLFLTGSPIRNHPSEMIPLMRGLGIDVPRDANKFRGEYIKEEHDSVGFIDRVFKGVRPGIKYDIKNKAKLKKMLKGKVDYHEASSDDYPSVDKEIIKTVMTKRQNEAYNQSLMSSPDLAYKIRSGMAPSKLESKRMNAFMSAVRQISNIPGDFNLKATDDDAPKMIEAVKRIEEMSKKEKDYRGVTYSSYLKSGLDPIKRMLDRKNISNALFTGKQTDKAKKNIIEDYNKGKIKQLLISGAGAEGLDLKGTRLMQILEPHWNNPQLDQVKGRAVRYKSHAHLPDSKRNVKIEQYLAEPRERGILVRDQDMGSDEYLMNMSDEKDKLNNKFLDILKEVSRETGFELDESLKQDNIWNMM